jgi:tripartite-type tricarboxylate transporter receptor subunit TctC
MTIDRRRFITASAAALAALPGWNAAFAQGWPAQDLHFVSAFGAGTGADLLARYFADKIRPLAGRAIVVENRPGALGHIATEYVARAKPDGYTVYVTGASSVAANQHLLKDPRLDVTEALQAAATIHQSTMTIVVRGDAPWKTLAELTAAMKQKGAKATYAYTNPPAQVLGAMYRQGAGLQAVEVPYKAGPDYLAALFNGELDFAVADNIQALEMTRAGRMRILAVGSRERLQVMSEYPTLTELGYPADVRIWMAALVPAATPRPAVEQINAWFNQVLAMPETKTFLNRIGGDPWANSPDFAQSYFKQQVKDWGEFVRIANIPKQ